MKDADEDDGNGREWIVVGDGDGEYWLGGIREEDREREVGKEAGLYEASGGDGEGVEEGGGEEEG